jgi:hypothetical protein
VFGVGLIDSAPGEMRVMLLRLRLMISGMLGAALLHSTSGSQDDRIRQPALLIHSISRGRGSSNHLPCRSLCIGSAGGYYDMRFVICDL